VPGATKGVSRGQEQFTVFTDYKSPPATLLEQWRGAAVVVRARVVQISNIREAITTPDAAHPSIPLTDATLEVVEILKDDGTVGVRRLLEVSESAAQIADTRGSSINIQLTKTPWLFHARAAGRAILRVVIAMKLFSS
jgi:hypothetical protein